MDGAIDCTHIKLIATRFNNLEEMYQNRKGYFSLTVQAVLGPRMEFLDIVPEWPGSAHDSSFSHDTRAESTDRKRNKVQLNPDKNPTNSGKNVRCLEASFPMSYKGFNNEVVMFHNNGSYMCCVAQFSPNFQRHSSRRR